MPLPVFRADGYLPVGIHLADLNEIDSALGGSSLRRGWLMARIAEWRELLRAVGGHRLVIDGSFVTARSDPRDVDAVCWLPGDFEALVDADDAAAVRLYRMLITRQPEELFGVSSQERWDLWIEFFSQTREADSRRKGLVEVRI